MTVNKSENEQRWREKYISLSEELDQKDQDHSDYLNTLHRALVRISLAADGQDKDLDKQLANLRNLLRKDPVDQFSINHNLSQVENVLLKLDKQHQDGGQQGFASIQVLVDQLLQLNLDKTQQRALKHFTKLLSKKDHQLSNYPSLLEQYRRLQQQALSVAFNSDSDSATAAGQSQQGGFFSRIFGAKNDNAVQPDAVEAAKTSVHREDSINPQGRPAAPPKESFSPQAASYSESETNMNSGTDNSNTTTTNSAADNLTASPVEKSIESAIKSTVENPVNNRSENSPDTQQAPLDTNTWDVTEVLLSSAINEPDIDSSIPEQTAAADTPETVIRILADLLEQLPLAPDIRGQAEQLRDHLGQLAAAGELDQIINQTAELVINALHKSQQEFEQFLLSLDRQLAQVTHFLDVQGQGNNARKHATGQLNLTVREQVDSISRSVSHAKDLSDLKVSVQNQLASIVSSMDVFVDTEQGREQALEKQLEEVQQQLILARAESQSIRKKLQTETLRALTDPLTGLPNREAFDERFTLERERFLRYKHPASLAILDIDYFKQVNDNHGHLVGDRVLQTFALTIKNLIRSTDFLGRYGGEEFVLIMPDTDASSAYSLLDKIRDTISKLPAKSLGTRQPITVSAGLASFKLGEKAGQLIERADKALYQAKDAGRDRVIVAES